MNIAAAAAAAGWGAAAAFNFLKVFGDVYGKFVVHELNYYKVDIVMIPSSDSRKASLLETFLLVHLFL